VAASRLRVFDSLTRTQVPVPLSAGANGVPELRLYVCGVTPYDTGHLGHAFTFMAFDVLIRWLESSGVRVRYVQNVTDVDDPLFERARRIGVDWASLAAQQVASFVSEMDALGWRRPDVMPAVSTEIPSILEAVTGLAARGFAYQTDAVYFDVSRYPSYGALSHRSRRSMIAKLRDEGLLGSVGPGAKQDALDFPLWRRSQPDEPAWASEFGPGRPGWHIECSAMAMRHLGATIDVHGGGRDLQFSHHESERAQSESLTGSVPFARVWMHAGLVRYQGHKMSKSLGNLVVVPQMLERASAAAVRLMLASHRYRRDWEFRWEQLDRAQALADRVRELFERAGYLEGEARGAGAGPGGPVRAPGAGGDRPGGELVERFRAAMDDDLDTPRAIRVLRAAVAAGDAPAVHRMMGVLAGTASLNRTGVAAGTR
jgi:L-cysteine:1D-myo-inositol 2-amino-2-deoxy-alpha-D-glucopyranoside ligase